MNILLLLPCQIDKLNGPDMMEEEGPAELSKSQIKDIIHFIESLTDTTRLTSSSCKLPKVSKDDRNIRKIGGEY